MKVREDVVCTVNKKLHNLSEDCEELKDKAARLERDCAKAQADYKSVCDNLESVMAKNKELTNKLKTLEHNLRMAEGELDEAVMKRESLKRDNVDMVTENKQLNAEIDQTLMSILEYEKMNK